MKSSALVWETLARKDREVVTTPELTDLANRLGKDPRHAIDHLVRARLLLPLFKGTYYVRKPDEVTLNRSRHSPLELFALGAEAKHIGRWYFGLDTALRLHGLTHEYKNTETVVSERLHRIRGIDFADKRFIIHKWKPEMFFGITRVKNLPVSDPAKTILDFAYVDYWAARRGRTHTGEWKTYVDRVDREAFETYLARSPRPLKEWVKAWS